MKLNQLALVGVLGFTLSAGLLLADNPNDFIHDRTYIGVVGRRSASTILVNFQEPITPERILLLMRYFSCRL